jgi:hypothetical protein
MESWTREVTDSPQHWKGICLEKGGGCQCKIRMCCCLLLHEGEPFGSFNLLAGNHHQRSETHHVDLEGYPLLVYRKRAYGEPPTTTNQGGYDDESPAG